MLAPMEFGQCLNSLLSCLGISNNRLAKSINVDSSLVNRWVNGKRIPAYNSNYIEFIADFLAQNVKNSAQSSCIDALFETVHGYEDETLSIQEKIKSCLYESQGYSLSKGKNAEHQQKVVNPASNNHSAQSIPHSFNQAVSLSPNDKIIYGTNNIIAACNYLLNLALITPTLAENKVYFTFANDVHFENYNKAEFHRFKHLLFKLLKSGWEIHCLFKLTDDVSRLARFIDFFIPLIGTGNLHIHYVNGYDSFDAGKEYFTVSGIGSLSWFSFYQKPSAAIYLCSPTATTIFEEHFEFYISTHSRPLLNYYLPEHGYDFFSSIAERECNCGNRVIYTDCFSVLTLPFELYKKILINCHLPDVEIARALELYQIRRQAFAKNITANQYHDIYMARSLKDLLKTHQLCLCDHNGLNSVYLDKEDAMEILLHLIHLLEKNKNYHITFLPEQYDPPWPDGLKLNCLVKEREAVFIEVMNSFSIEQDVKLSIEEPLMVHTFEVYFGALLNKVSPTLKNKEQQIAWLRRNVEILSNIG